MKATASIKKYDLNAFKIPLNVNRKGKVQKRVMGMQESKSISLKTGVSKKQPVKKVNAKMNRKTMF